MLSTRMAIRRCTTPVSRGHDKVARLLIDKGANIDAVNKDGKTPLDDAKSRNEQAVVKLLEDVQAGRIVPGGRSRKERSIDTSMLKLTRDGTTIGIDAMVSLMTFFPMYRIHLSDLLYGTLLTFFLYFIVCDRMQMRRSKRFMIV